MISNKTNMLDFRHFTVEDKQIYEKYLFASDIRGCEYSFANLYLWGRQSFAIVNGSIIMFSQFDRRTVYPFPIGGDTKSAIDAIIADSKARGIPCRITGLLESEKELLEALYPQKFRFHCDEGSFDYVYDINDLAELKGKKYHSKKNHFNRFCEEHPDYRIEPIDEHNAVAVLEMVNEWYEAKLADNPNSDYHMEKAAIEKALKHFEELELEGLVLTNNGEILAMTVGSRLSSDTLDVHFEKAKAGINGAYAAINCEFARYIRDKHPEIKYLDREEDMGLEGLRKAKRSYHPHHQVYKCWACLLEDGYDY